jgi:predicted deacetylase
LCVATIPFAKAADGARSCSRKNASHLVDALRAGTIEIAQHGHSQVRRGTTDRGAPSEFFGVPFEEQSRLITEGNAHLAALLQRRIKGFVPPWNTYDHSTLRALARAGFEFLSAGPEIVKFDTLPVVPATCTLHNARQALEDAWYFQAVAPLLVVVFHPDDFEEFKLPPLPADPSGYTSLRA